MQLSTATNQTIDISNSTTEQKVAQKAKATQGHTLWDHIKEDKAIQAMLVVVSASVITNIMVLF